MKDLIITLLVLAFIGWVFSPMLKASFTWAPRPLSLAINTGTTAPNAEHTLSLLPTAAHAANVLVKRAAAGYYAVCGANDEPFGIVKTEVTTSDLALGRKQAVHILGLYRSPLEVVASEALATSGTHLYTAANGTVQDEPAAAGTYYCVGQTNAPVASGGKVPISHWQPDKLVVLAALTCTDGTAGGAADLTALKAEMEKATDDLRRISAALAGGRTRVKILSA